MVNVPFEGRSTPDETAHSRTEERSSLVQRRGPNSIPFSCKREQPLNREEEKRGEIPIDKNHLSARRFDELFLRKGMKDEREREKSVGVVLSRSMRRVNPVLWKKEIWKGRIMTRRIVDKKTIEHPPLNSFACGGLLPSPSLC